MLRLLVAAAVAPRSSLRALRRVWAVRLEQLRRLMRQYVAYYNEDRTHLTIGKDTPASRAVESAPGPGARVVSLPRVGGLHRRYAWRRAA